MVNKLKRVKSIMECFIDYLFSSIKKEVIKGITQNAVPAWHKPPGITSWGSVLGNLEQGGVTRTQQGSPVDTASANPSTLLGHKIGELR